MMTYFDVNPSSIGQTWRVYDPLGLYLGRFDINMKRWDALLSGVSLCEYAKEQGYSDEELEKAIYATILQCVIECSDYVATDIPGEGGSTEVKLIQEINEDDLVTLQYEYERRETNLVLIGAFTFDQHVEMIERYLEALETDKTGVKYVSS